MTAFRAYLITPPAGPREWDTVRDRAKARGRELGGTSEEVEVPATKAELIPFLNDLEKRLAAPLAAEEHAEAPTPPPAPVALPSAPPAAPAVGNIAALEAWIMDEAPQAHIERIFTALGVRFGEAVRENRRAA